MTRFVPKQASLELSPFQHRVLAVPEDVDLFLGGGRGGSKSYTFAILQLRHVSQYEEDAKVLYLRRTWPGIADFASNARKVFRGAFGPRVSYNQSSGLFTFDTGASVWLRPLDDPDTYDALQGQSFTLICADEVGQYPSLGIVEMCRSNMRGPKGVPLRMAYASNPGGPSHYTISQRFVTAQPWRISLDPVSGRKFVHAPSTYRDNPFIDQEQYRAQLIAATSGNDDLQRAWLDGSWDALTAGAFFGGCFAMNRNIVHWRPSPIAQSWRPFVSVDHGSAAPCVVGLLARSPGATGPDGHFYPRGSLIELDEYHTARDDLVTGKGYTVPRICEGIKELCARWGIHNIKGCGDDAMFARHRGIGAATIADEYIREGVNLNPAKKSDRKTGWTTMSRLLADAGKPDKPGLYINDLCRYSIVTLPILGRDLRDPEDLDSDGPDHAADQLRYACIYLPTTLGFGRRSYP
jgi:hypothetical protein